MTREMNQSEFHAIQTVVILLELFSLGVIFALCYPLLDSLKKTAIVLSAIELLKNYTMIVYPLQRNVVPQIDALVQRVG
jgi:hypothetical protein